MDQYQFLDFKLTSKLNNSKELPFHSYFANFSPKIVAKPNSTKSFTSPKGLILLVIRALEDKVRDYQLQGAIISFIDYTMPIILLMLLLRDDLQTMAKGRSNLKIARFINVY